MTTGTHSHTHDTRNETILISINGELKSRSEAMVSVFDSGFILGDGVWEGLRLHRGIIAFLQEHMDRLYEGATAIDLDIDMRTDICFLSYLSLTLWLKLILSEF